MIRGKDDEHNITNLEAFIEGYIWKALTIQIKTTPFVRVKAIYLYTLNAKFLTEMMIIIMLSFNSFWIYRFVIMFSV